MSAVTTPTSAATQILPGSTGLTASLAIPAGSDPTALANDAHLLVGAAIGIIDNMEELVKDLSAANALWGAKLMLVQALALMGSHLEGGAA